MKSLLLIFSLMLFVSSAFSAFKEENCEVCVKAIGNFADTLEDSDLGNEAQIEEKFKQFCKKSKGKESRLCYYLGGMDDSATGILKAVSKPLSYKKPALKICEQLKKLDGEICNLKYDKVIDVNNVDLKKLKVADLKKILSSWDEVCDGCLEKSEYINKINEVKHKHVKSTKTEL